MILQAHVNTGHGGEIKTFKKLQERYCNISRKICKVFISFCKNCHESKSKHIRKGVVVKPILSKEYNSRGQVDLVDFQSQPYKTNNGITYKWMLQYQDHLTKFVHLKPLQSKRAAKVAFSLHEIFMVFGCPSILQSDNGREFVAQVIKELKGLWPDFVIVHGKPRHPQSQGSVERSNQDIKIMICNWLKDNSTLNWPFALKFVAHMKNNSFHSGIGRAPYEAVFGTKQKVGLLTSSLPTEILKTLETEEDLQSALNSSPNNDEESRKLTRC